MRRLNAESVQKRQLELVDNGPAGMPEYSLAMGGRDSLWLRLDGQEPREPQVSMTASYGKLKASCAVVTVGSAVVLRLDTKTSQIWERMARRHPVVITVDDPPDGAGKGLGLWELILSPP